MKEETKLLKKLLNCAYIIIALLTINTILVAVSNVEISTKDDGKKAEEKAQESSDYDVSMMNEIDMDKLIDLFDSKETQVVYLGRATCGYCVQFLPTLQKAQQEYDYTTQYLDITTVSDTSKLMEKDNDEKFLEENYGATPMVILVKDGKLVDTWVGYDEYDKFAQFLEKNGFEK